MDIIKSFDNSKLKELRKLKDKKYRTKNKLFLVEGITLVKSMPNFAVIKDLFVKESLFEKEKDFIVSNNINYHIVEDKIFNRCSETECPSGFYAVVSITENNSDEKSNAIILDAIRDPGNMGTIIRTAVSLGYYNIYLVNSCADPYSGKCVRSTMGGIFFVNIKDIKDINLLKNELAEYDIITLDMAGKSIKDFKSEKDKIALVVGNEAHGVSKEVRDISDNFVSLPMNGKIESLNAAMACGISMYILGGIK